MNIKRIYKIILFFLGVIILSTTLLSQQKKTYAQTDPANPLLNQGPKKEAVGDKFMVSTQLASSTKAAVKVLEKGGNAVDAAEAPRFWAFRERDTIDMESRISDKVRKGLAAKGIRINDLGNYNFHTGSMQIVWKDVKTGKIHGVTDPRRLGYAAGK